MATQLALSVWAVGLAYEDWRWRRLPNVLLAVGIVVGLAHWLIHGVMPLGVPMAEGSLAAAVGLLALLPSYRAGWLGAGDVKFFSVIGWLVGLRALLATFLVASVVAGGLALLLSIPVCRQHMSDRQLEARLRRRIPFGVGLSIALIALASGRLDPAILSFS